MNNKAGIWIVGLVLLFVALGVQGLTVQKIGLGPLTVDFADRETNGGQDTGPGPGPTTSPPDTRVAVPELAGRTRGDAENLLAGAGLQGSFALVDSVRPVDVVVRTDPGAGTRVEAHSTVRVEISQGPFAGTWVSEDPRTRGVPQLTIESLTATKATVRIWGSCTPSWCDWGGASAAVSGARITAYYNPSFARRKVTITRVGSQLRLEILTHFIDNSGRADYTTVELMNRK